MRYFLLITIFLFFACENKSYINEKSLQFSLKSDTLVNKGEYQMALSLVEKALQLDNNNYFAFNNLGIVKHILGYPENEVLEALTKSYELNQNYEIGLYNLTNYHLQLKNYSEVINLGSLYIDRADRYGRNRNNKAQVYAIIGESYNYLKSFDKAEYYLTKSLKINSKIPEAYKERGIAFKNLGKLSEALKDFNEAIDLNPFYHQAYNSRAIYFDDLEQNEKALMDYNKAINLDPKSSVYYLNRAEFRIKIGEIEKACEDITKSDSLGNEEARNYYLKYCKK